MTIYFNDPRAIELRNWLNERCKHYQTTPVSDAELAAWLDDAEANEGLVEIRARFDQRHARNLQDLMAGTYHQ